MTQVRTYSDISDVLTELQQNLLLELSINKTLQKSQFQDKINKLKFIMKYMEAENHNDQSCQCCQQFDPQKVIFSEMKFDDENYTLICEQLSKIEADQLDLNDPIPEFLGRFSKYWGDYTQYKNIDDGIFLEETIAYYYNLKQKVQKLVKFKKSKKNQLQLRLVFNIDLLDSFTPISDDEQNIIQQNIIELIISLNQYKRRLDKYVFEQLSEQSQTQIRKKMLQMLDDIAVFFPLIQIYRGVGILNFMKKLEPKTSCQKILKEKYLEKIFQFGDIDLNTNTTKTKDQIKTFLKYMIEKVGPIQVLNEQNIKIDTKQQYNYCKILRDQSNVLDSKQQYIKEFNGYYIERTTQRINNKTIFTRYKIQAPYEYQNGNIVQNVKFTLLDIFVQLSSLIQPAINTSKIMLYDDLRVEIQKIFTNDTLVQQFVSPDDITTKSFDEKQDIQASQPNIVENKEQIIKDIVSTINGGLLQENKPDNTLERYHNKNISGGCTFQFGCTY